MRQAQKQSQRAILYTINPGCERNMRALISYVMQMLYVIIDSRKIGYSWTWKHGEWPPTPCSMQNANGLRFPIPVPFTHFKVYLLLYPFRVSIHLSIYLPRRSFSLSCSLRCRLEWKQRRKEIPNNSRPYHKSKATSYLRKTFTWFNHLQIQNKWGDHFWSPPR